MHELSITQNLVAIVEEHAQGQRVKRVTLEIGKLSGVMADAIRFCFDTCTENTLLAGARLEILEQAGEVTCRRCGLEFSVQQLYEFVTADRPHWPFALGINSTSRKWSLANV